MELTVGDTVILLLTEELFQVYDCAPVTIKLTEDPRHKVFVPDIVRVGLSCTRTPAVVETIQPDAVVPVMVYTVVLSGDTITLVFVDPVLQV